MIVLLMSDGRGFLNPQETYRSEELIAWLVIDLNVINKKTLEQYFTLLNCVLGEPNLHSKPAQMYNVDYAGVPFDYKVPNVAAKMGFKKIRYRQSGKKGQVTVAACASVVSKKFPRGLFLMLKILIMLGQKMRFLEQDMG